MTIHKEEDKVYVEFPVAMLGRELLLTSSIENTSDGGEGAPGQLLSLIHIFDIMRLFAPSMETDDGKKYIPYVDSYPVISTTYYTNTEILKTVSYTHLWNSDLIRKK